MAKSINFGGVNVGLSVDPGATPDAASSFEPAQPRDPFHIAILGDFSGRTSRGLKSSGHELGNTKIIQVDRDNYDDIMAHLGVELHLDLLGPDKPKVVMRFAELDDFHPDRIYDRVELFDVLRRTRRRLENPDTFEAAAREVQGLAGSEPAASDTPPPQSSAEPDGPELSGLSGGELLDAILGGGSPDAGSQTSTPAASPSIPGGGSWDQVIRDIVAPYVTPGADPRKAELVAAVDRSVSARMAQILHHPQFQQIEAAWRGLYLLVRKLETDTKLKLFLIDVSQGEVADDLMTADDPRRSGMVKLLVDRSVGTPGAQPWALFASLFTFDATAREAMEAGRLAQLAAQAGAPLLAAGTASLVGCTSLVETPDPDDWNRPWDADAQTTWRQLRALPAAHWLGLALPRFLLRHPYGRDGDAVERFEFIEQPDPPEHEAFLWGHPSLLIAFLLGASYTNSGWNLRPGMFRELAGLPVHIYSDDGEASAYPCAETLLSTRAAETIAAAGLIAVQSVKGRDAVQVFRVVSLAHPAAALRGRWGS